MTTILNKIKKYYPEFINPDNEDEIKIYENQNLIYKKYSSSLNERFFYTLFTGRHFAIQKYEGMKTEDCLDLSLLESFSNNKSKIDISFKDLEGRYIALVENACLENASIDNLEIKVKEKFAQVFKYLLIIADPKYPADFSEKVFLQVNVYQEDLLLKNNKQYETYMGSNKEISDEELFLKTGISQKVWIFNRKDILKIQKMFPSGFSKDQLNKGYLKDIFETKFDESTNFSLINLTNTKQIIDDDETTEFLFKPDMNTFENNFLLNRIPFRSVQKSGSPYDNTREVNEEQIKEYVLGIAQNFWNGLKEFDFNSNNNPAILSELKKPGWNDRRLKASLEKTMISTNSDNSHSVIFSTNIALSNEQHNSFALLRLKQLINNCPNDFLSQKNLLTVELGIEDKNNIEPYQINTFFELVKTVNPKIEVNLYLDDFNGQNAVKISNINKTQSEYDKAQYKEKSKLQVLSTAINFEYEKYHCYVSTDITQDPNQRVTSTLTPFNISRLSLINSSYKRGRKTCKDFLKDKKKIQETLKIFKDNGNFIKSQTETSKILEFLFSDEEFIDFIFQRRIFNLGDKNTENHNSIKELFEENVIGKKNKKSKSERARINLIEFLTEQQDNMDKYNLKKVEQIIYSFGNSYPKEISHILSKLKALINNILEFNLKEKLDSEIVEKFITDLIKASIEINTKRLIEMIEITLFMENNKQKQNFKEIFHSEEIIIRLISAIMGAKNEELDLVNFQKYYNIVAKNISNSEIEKWQPVDLRNKQANFILAEHIVALKDLFVGINFEYK